MRTKWTAPVICALAAFFFAGFCGCGDGNGPGAGDTMSVDLGGGVEMEFAWIPPGNYRRGGRFSPKRAARRYGGPALGFGFEHPRHRVRLTKGFWMGRTPVTQAQWKAVMDTTVGAQRDKADPERPLTGEGDNYPMYYVSWNEAMEFAKRLSEQAEGTFRLPTEAEWEYACRAGTKTEFYFGNDARRLGDYAWYGGNTDQTQPVAQKKPNAWGLYDMHGNINEWCADWFREYPSGTVTDPLGTDGWGMRVLRGGSWANPSWFCRSASRLPIIVGGYSGPSRSDRIGFRIVLGSPVKIPANDVEAAPIARETVDMGGGVSMEFVNIPDTNTDFSASLQPAERGFTGEMGRYPVTNAQYARYLNDALASGDVKVDLDGSDRLKNPAEQVTGTTGEFEGKNYYRLDGSGWTVAGATNGGKSRISYSDGGFTVERGLDEHPVTYVSWYGAVAFAGYYGWRLPTQWEWGSVANYNDPVSRTWTYATGGSMTVSSQADAPEDGIEREHGETWYLANYWDYQAAQHGTTPVGYFGYYGYGLADMSGNVWEWTTSTSRNGAARVVRGGSWGANINFCAVRPVQHNLRADLPDLQSDDSGFRVCR